MCSEILRATRRSPTYGLRDFNNGEKKRATRIHLLVRILWGLRRAAGIACTVIEAEGFLMGAADFYILIFK